MLCREIGINRQQFARYLGGTSKPSTYNLRKIAGHFAIPVVDLSMAHEEFAELHGENLTADIARKSGAAGAMRGISLGNMEALKAYAGYYYTYLQTPADPTRILQSLAHLHFDGKNMLSKIFEQLGKMPDGTRPRSNYEGVVSLLNDCIFIIDIETTTYDTILETILRVPYRRKSSVYFGVTTGMTTGHRRIPFASIAAWKFLGKTIDRRSKLERCGFCDLNATSIDPLIREAFANQNACFLYPKTLERI